MTEADSMLHAFAQNPRDETLQKAMLDCRSESGCPLATELLEVERALETETLHCDMWMFSCGELLSTLTDLAREGCTRCRRYASLRLLQTTLWSALVVTARQEAPA